MKKNGKVEYLMQRRGRQPFYGDVNGIAGKLSKGEMVVDAAKRKLTEETGLDVEFQFLGVHRKIKRNTEGELLEDVLYHVCHAKDPLGELENIQEDCR